MNIGSKVKYGNLTATVKFIVYPTMKALIVMTRNGARRLVKMKELKEEVAS